MQAHRVNHHDAGTTRERVCGAILRSFRQRGLSLKDVFENATMMHDVVRRAKVVSSKVLRDCEDAKTCVDHVGLMGKQSAKSIVRGRRQTKPHSLQRALEEDCPSQHKQ
eukprot:4508199-Amphidinium_carterae.1